MLQFQIDKRKIVTEGGGSVTAYCEKNGIDYRILANIMASKRRHFSSKSKTRIVAERLVALGVARWEDVEDQILSA